MDVARLVLGVSPDLSWRKSDMVIVVNDGRSGCIGLWRAGGGGNGGCVKGWELHCK
jgi:hypothetical protein